jgi:hypothetical protein
MWLWITSRPMGERYDRLPGPAADLIGKRGFSHWLGENAAISLIPTFAEMGLPALHWSCWFGLFAPKGHAETHHRQTQCGGRGGNG